MKFSLMTYNLLFNQASRELKSVFASYKPDLLCFQEIDTDEHNLKKIKELGYSLADYSNSFIRSGHIFGVATFYNPRVFTLTNSQTFNLPNSLYQIITFILRNKKSPRTVLKNEFVFKKNGKRITTYNIHLTPLATNGLRLKQIKNTFHDLRLAKESPVVIAGDFNFPYRRKKFEEIILAYKLKEATNNIPFTLERRFLRIISIRLKLDYILYKNLKLKSNDMVQIRHSDHFPILSYFQV